MASTPQFTGTPKCRVASVSTANTNRDGTGTIVDILTAAGTGTKLNRIVVKATADPADSVVTIFIHDGTAYRIFDEFDLADPAAGSATVATYRGEKSYDDIVLENGQKLAAAITAAPTSGAVLVFAFAGDF